MNIWFATFLNSRKALQITKNPEVHLTLGVNDPQTAVSWLQVQGRAQLFEDAETKNTVWYDMLSSIFSGPDDPNYVVCKVKPSRIPSIPIDRTMSGRKNASASWKQNWQTLMKPSTA